MNTITITSKPKEKVIDAAKRAVNNSILYGKTVKLDYRGITCDVTPTTSVASVIQEVAKFNNILKKHKL